MDIFSVSPKETQEGLKEMFGKGPMGFRNQSVRLHSFY